MNALPVGTHITIPKRAWVHTPERIEATVTRVNVGRALTTYTLQLDTQHWRVLSQREMDKVAVIVSTPLPRAA